MKGLIESKKSTIFETQRDSRVVLLPPRDSFLSFVLKWENDPANERNILLPL